jgi:hypothetical protein
MPRRPVKWGSDPFVDGRNPIARGLIARGLSPGTPLQKSAIITRQSPIHPLRPPACQRVPKSGEKRGDCPQFLVWDLIKRAMPRRPVKWVFDPFVDKRDRFVTYTHGLGRPCYGRKKTRDSPSSYSSRGDCPRFLVIFIGRADHSPSAPGMMWGYLA